MTCCDHQDKRRFQPNYSRKPLTVKFYARHDHVDEDDHMHDVILHYKSELVKRMEFDARKIRFAPLTENQMYGWQEREILRYGANDEDYIRYPRRTDSAMAILQKIYCKMLHDRRAYNIK